MKYKIHQIRLNELERAIVDQKGHQALTKQIRKLDMEFAEGDVLKKLTHESLKAGDYDYVADITANNLDEVFYIGNMDIPREENAHINDIDDMYSVSMGNIIESDEARYVVASMGFVKI